MEDRFDGIIVGGGIVGAATLYQLQKRHPERRFLLLEKEDHLAGHQTGHNSGVIHSGIYYKPGSLKATNCVKGRRELVRFAQEHAIPHDVCGKVIVATDESEFPFLDKIHARGLENDIEGVERIDADGIREVEPECSGIKGVWVPCTGIIDFPAATEKMAELARGMQEKTRVVTGEAVTGHQEEGEETLVYTDQRVYRTSHVIYCGGLQSDRLAKKDGVDLKEKVVGFRGDYYELTEKAQEKVKNLIYPVPDPAFPFLGVHFTRMIHGGVECGPNAVFTFKREGYGKTDLDLRDTLDALSYKGTWKLFFKHWQFGLDEYRRAFSKKLFLNRLRRLIPSLEMDDIEPGRAGVRAMLLDQEGEMVDDFRIEYKSNSIHVLNAPSPAATASLSIGEYISEMAEERFRWR